MWGVPLLLEAAMAVIPGQATVGDVRLAAKQRADMVNSTFITDGEWNSMITRSQQELYDLLVQKFGDYYFVADPFDITADGTNEKYTLPTDFFKLLGVNYIANNNPNGYITLRPFNFAERNRFAFPALNAVSSVWNPPKYQLNGNKIWFRPLPSGGQQFQVLYVPRIPLATDIGSITLNDISAGAQLDLTVTVTQPDLTVTASCLAVDGTPGGNDQFQVGVTDSETATNLAASLTALFYNQTQLSFAATANNNTVNISLGLLGTVTWTSDGGAGAMVLSPLTGFDNLIDGVNGWEEYIIVDAALKAIEKEESDPSALMSDKGSLIQRIEAAAENRDAGMSATVSDVLDTTGADWGWAFDGSGGGGP